ncbi:hypothetical protein Clacol_002411 [Clathrus columnatus]|uniref:Selenoprotein O n=1 Tax=Clathrus columnatus TaxID=1419009 RepID=A0AAV5A6E1_9AGAM|nr:hypothetical protein Clacol_002411 [Clathrus columnatus]
MSKSFLSDLPLPPSTHVLQRNLIADPNTPDPDVFFNDVMKTRPSIQRRARLLAPSAHFSFVSPYPTAFPYRIEVVDEEEDRTKAIEKWLSAKEALTEANKCAETGLGSYSADERVKDYHLIGLCRRGIEDCLPNLDVGDAFEYLGPPSLTPNGVKANGHASIRAQSEEESARQNLTDILSGHNVLLKPSKSDGYAPWSLRYSGHQFGTWAGQLGDGRAISILETPHPNDPNLIYELQLKGAGRTPFSRSADGLAVLRSSIREYLGAEAAHALGIPTTRSLSLTLYPTLPVIRESPIPEKAAIVTRMAPSFIRIGNFEGVSHPPDSYSFSYVGQQDDDFEALRVLGEWVASRVLQLNLGPHKDGQPPAWGKELVFECARRNARMVAGWQVYGFMHGVMNTDNISILGLTIDYGPYAFMDVFNDGQICNHTDEGGRYAYKFQPTMIIYALRALLTSLGPLIGAEMELGHAVPKGWANDIPKDKLENWREDAMELKQELDEQILGLFGETYYSSMRKRLGLRRNVDSDPSQLIRPLLQLLERHELDFNSSFRTLTNFVPTSDVSNLEAFTTHLTPEYLISSETKRDDAKKDWVEWLQKFSKRIEDEKDDWDSSDDWLTTRKIEAKKSNPRFVLRQWVLEEVIKKVDEDYNEGKHILAKVLEMTSRPFESWGGEDASGPEEELSEEIREERRLCGLGPKRFLGFQCSCSS